MRCSVDECDRSDIQGKGLCQMHYTRWYRNGTTEAKRPQRASRGTCVIEGCYAIDCGPRGLCPKHKARERRNGGPLVLKGGPPVRRGSEHPNWSGDAASYNAMHMRVRAERGPARNQNCVDCAEPAAHWSYDRKDVDERSSHEGPYSVRVEHYEARCVPCHKRFDLGARDATS